MSIAIILRKRHNINRFRDLMIEVIRTRCGDNALLCSGFFQEGFHGNGYRASQESQFANILASTGIQLTTVGIHNNTWMNSYQNFRDSLVNAKVNLIAYYKSGLRWHAKVFILSKGSNSIFGIIGSSNLTRNAFGVDRNFNNECDVLLWTNTDQNISKVVGEFLGTNNLNPDEIIRGLYDNERNFNLTVQDRLNNLKQEILESELRELD